jgi:hypothetical protein
MPMFSAPIDVVNEWLAEAEIAIRPKPCTMPSKVCYARRNNNCNNAFVCKEQGEE